MKRWRKELRLAVWGLAMAGWAIACGAAAGGEPAPEGKSGAELPQLWQEDFEKGADAWKPTDEKAWKVVEKEGGRFYSLFQQSKYAPKHRSPLNISLRSEPAVEDFVLTAKVRSTGRDYGHRDVCFFFGYQNPEHFYYVHLARNKDDHANQIFIVNGAPRVKISTKTSEGTRWDDGWHNVRIERNASTGKIAVYFDDGQEPVMTAEDKTFTHGQVGLGSFDDTADFDDVTLRGKAIQK